MELSNVYHISPGRGSSVAKLVSDDVFCYGRCLDSFVSLCVFGQCGYWSPMAEISLPCATSCRLFCYVFRFFLYISGFRPYVGNAVCQCCVPRHWGDKQVDLRAFCCKSE